ncbi:helix-turn-helix domain-containing protein, partial [Sphingomonas yabuuchiae]
GGSYVRATPGLRFPPHVIYDVADPSTAMSLCIGANIARELKKLGITQGELSERSGVAASHISYMVRGHGNPTLATLESLADVFGLSVVELLAADSTSRDKS